MTSIYISWIEGSLSLMLVVTYDYQQVNGKNNDHLIADVRGHLWLPASHWLKENDHLIADDPGH